MDESINNQHDKAYKDLLSNKEYFVKLLKSFVHEDWVNDINENSLEYENKSYILHDYNNKESDIVFKMKLQDTEVILYCLLELQSSNDHSMPIRLLFYMTSIWNEILKNTKQEEIEKSNFKLPAIIPMVLTNAKENWTVKRNFKEIINNYEMFSNHILDFNYILFDINRYSEDELLKLSNIVSTIFYLDQKYKGNEIKEKLQRILYILKRFEKKEIRLLKKWLKYILIPRVPTETKNEINNILNENIEDTEVEIMVSNLATTIDEYWAEIRAEGEIKGRTEGKAEGKAEGEIEGEIKGRALSIIKIFTRKFSPVVLDDIIKKSIMNQKNIILDDILDKVFEINSIEELRSYLK